MWDFGDKVALMRGRSGDGVCCLAFVRAALAEAWAEDLAVQVNWWGLGERLPCWVHAPWVTSFRCWSTAPAPAIEHSCIGFFLSIEKVQR